MSIGTLGITIVRAFNGTATIGLASIAGGALALVTALLARQQMEKKKLLKNNIHSSTNQYS